jgi:PEP-CTERM motif
MSSSVEKLMRLISCVTVLGIASSAWGQTPASGDFSGPSVESVHDMQTMPGGSGWEIGSEAAPIEVILDPAAGPWIKNLRGFNGGNVVADDTGFTAPSGYQKEEWLVIGGNTPWTDWHEEVLTPGWNIGAQIDINGGQPVPGLVVDLMFTDWPNTGGAVWMDFDPLPPGTLVHLTKQLSWVGDPQVNGNLFNGVIQIAEYPTPEPATIALMGLGVLALGRRCRS